MVSLVQQGWANQSEVARAFGCAARTVRPNQQRFEDGGLAALGQPRGYPEGRVRLAGSWRRTVQQLKAQGHSNCEIARRLAVSEKAIRKLARLAAAQRAAQFGQALAQQRVALRGAALGFLYTDGHMRVYHGQHTLPKAHVARMCASRCQPRRITGSTIAPATRCS